jgi:hypothetical protein
MSQLYTCRKCGKTPETTPLFDVAWYHVAYGGLEHHYCSRVCLVEFIAPELKQVAVIKQWVPTPEEEKRMSEDAT